MILDTVKQKYQEHIFLTPIAESEDTAKATEACIESVRNLLHQQTGIAKEDFLIQNHGRVKVGWLKAVTLTGKVSPCFTDAPGHLHDQQKIGSTNSQKEPLQNKDRFCHVLNCSYDALCNLADEKAKEVEQSNELQRVFSETLAAYIQNSSETQKSVFFSDVWAINGMCGVCDENGTVSCNQCGASGKQTCPQCSGKGEWLCNTCSGNGTIVCRSCKGRGTEDVAETKEISHNCSHCQGRGENSFYDDSSNSWTNHSCSFCHGTGRYTASYTKQENITCRFCKGTGKEQCSSCSGTGIIGCSRCGGYGVIDCPTCHGKSRITCSLCNGAQKKGIVDFK